MKILNILKYIFFFTKFKRELTNAFFDLPKKSDESRPSQADGVNASQQNIIKIDVKKETKEDEDDPVLAQAKYLKLQQEPNITYRNSENKIYDKWLSNIQQVDNNEANEAATELKSKLDEQKYMLVEDYAEEIFGYFDFLEEKLQVTNDFMANKEVTWKHRARIVNSLIEFHHKNDFVIEVIFKCVQLIDAYLQVF